MIIIVDRHHDQVHICAIARSHPSPLSWLHIAGTSSSLPSPGSTTGTRYLSIIASITIKGFHHPLPPGHFKCTMYHDWYLQTGLTIKSLTPGATLKIQMLQVTNTPVTLADTKCGSMQEDLSRERMYTLEVNHDRLVLKASIIVTSFTI